MSEHETSNSGVAEAPEATDEILATDPETGKELLRIGPGGRHLPDYATDATEGQVVAAKLLVERQQHGQTLQECVSLAQRNADLAKQNAATVKQLAEAMEKASHAQQEAAQARLQLARLKMQNMESDNKSLFSQVGLAENATITDDPERWGISGRTKGEWFVVDTKAHEAANAAKAENGAG